MTLREMVDTAYRVLTGSETATGSVNWFHAHLRSEGIDVTKQAVASWLKNDRVPDARAVSVHRILFGLNTKAAETAIEELTDETHALATEMSAAVETMKRVGDQLKTLEDA